MQGVGEGVWARDFIVLFYLAATKHAARIMGVVTMVVNYRRCFCAK